MYKQFTLFQEIVLSIKINNKFQNVHLIKQIIIYLYFQSIIPHKLFPYILNVMIFRNNIIIFGVGDNKRQSKIFIFNLSNNEISNV